jgi:rhodanese-related sulfurtransferase
MSLTTLTPTEAMAKLAAGAKLIDIREADEFARERIGAATNLPMSQIGAASPRLSGTVIFHCRSGNRTAVNAARLKTLVEGGDAHILEGGIEAWRDGGLPTIKVAGQPIEIMRQVQIGAGGLVLLGVLLGWLAHPGFYALSGFVGAGLVMAGATGFCGMARLLALAPWNRRAQPA